MMFQSTAAAGLLFTLGASAQSVISSGQGFGTYYYDIDQVDACGTTFEYQNQGGVMCSSETLLSLNEMDTNYVVAMNNTQLRADPSQYCGKKVVVTVNGQKSDLQLFIGDGCQRCGTGSSTSDTWNSEGAPGLDFSYSVLDQLSGGSACNDGHVSISWEILDETIYNFDGSSSGFTSSSGSSSSDTSSSQSATPTTMQTSASAAQSTASSTACSDNAWQCNGDVLEQCIGSTWTPRATCAAGSSCKGGSNPYCS
ncbi:uncharacterized protein N7496_002634 [Penicillium cataractarum]|uniref:Uncharacterized protein n=1 Tax=Penicillium cataractarum TaxID=2100454 RepID=A0A9W9SKE5_9EURO|nr:uncharacterized protein N7496_002634 [Penicillium cataractarum]KAJ5380206.1 hypothetical protein N7496_002634 [Penicillium cataractarum]